MLGFGAPELRGRAFGRLSDVGQVARGLWMRSDNYSLVGEAFKGAHRNLLSRSLGHRPEETRTGHLPTVRSSFWRTAATAFPLLWSSVDQIRCLGVLHRPWPSHVRWGRRARTMTNSSLAQLRRHPSTLLAPATPGRPDLARGGLCGLGAIGRSVARAGLYERGPTHSEAAPQKEL